jgi:hypothetical protein
MCRFCFLNAFSSSCKAFQGRFEKQDLLKLPVIFHLSNCFYVKEEFEDEQNMNILHSPDSMGFERVQKNLQKNRMTG